MSKKTTPTWYRSLKGWKYELRRNMEIRVSIAATAKNKYIWLSTNRLLVYKHYHWDGPSGPTWDRSQNMRASLFHDALCQLIGEGLLDKKYRKYVDQLFRQHLLEDGMGKFWAWGYYMAVRGWSKLKGM